MILEFYGMWGLLTKVGEHRKKEEETHSLGFLKLMSDLWLQKPKTKQWGNKKVPAKIKPQHQKTQNKTKTKTT